MNRGSLFASAALLAVVAANTSATAQSAGEDIEALGAQHEDVGEDVRDEINTEIAGKDSQKTLPLGVL